MRAVAACAYGKKLRDESRTNFRTRVCFLPKTAAHCAVTVPLNHKRCNKGYLAPNPIARVITSFMISFVPL